MTAVPKALDRRFREAATEAGLVDVSFDVADTQIGRSSSPSPSAGSAGFVRSRAGPGDRDARPDVRGACPARAARARSRAPRARRVLRGPPPRLRPAARPARPRRLLARHPRASRESALRRGHDLQVAGRRGWQPSRGPRGRDDHEPQSDPDRAPRHRVVGSNGSLVGYGGGLERKRLLLDLEAGTPRLDIH